MTDRFGVAWSGGWEPLTSTSKYAYTAVAESAPGVVSATSGGVTQTGYNNFNPAAGIGWAVDLTAGFSKNGNVYSTTRHKGWGKVNAQKKHNGSGSQDISSAVANYFHRQAVCVGAINLDFTSTGGTPKLGISCSLSHDKSQDKATNIYWKHSNNP